MLVAFYDVIRRREQKERQTLVFCCPGKRKSARALLHIIIDIYSGATHVFVFFKREKENPLPKKIPFKKEFRVYIFFLKEEKKNFEAPSRASLTRLSGTNLPRRRKRDAVR